MKASYRNQIYSGNGLWSRKTNLDALVFLAVALCPILTIVARNHVFNRYANVIRAVVQDLDGGSGGFAWLDRGVVRKVERFEILVVV